MSRFNIEDDVWVKTKTGIILEGKIIKKLVKVQDHYVKFKVQFIRTDISEGDYYHWDLFLRPQEKEYLLQTLYYQLEDIHNSIKELENGNNKKRNKNQ